MEGETIQIEGKTKYKTRILATLEKLSYCSYLLGGFFGSIFSPRKLKQSVEILTINKQGRKPVLLYCCSKNLSI